MTTMFKPKFMNSEYAYPDISYNLKQEAPTNIHSLFQKLLSDEPMTAEEQIKLFTSSFFQQKIKSWKFLPEAPQEIKKEVNWFNKFVLEEDIDSTSDENNSFTKP